MSEQSLLPSHRMLIWQSTDKHMEAGLVPDATPFYYARLGNRPVTLTDIEGFIWFMAQLEQPYPLLLLSNCPGFAPSPADEANGLVFYAGQYRALQQQQKQQGRLILSVIHQIAVGGTYLMHGLSAHIRAATPDTQFHDTVPNHLSVPLAQALERRLIDTIIPKEQLSEWLRQNLHKTQPEP